MKAIDKRSIENLFSLIPILILIVSFSVCSPSYSQDNPTPKQQITKNQNEFVITQNTSQEELDSIIQVMKNVGLILHYTNLDYNNNEQITSISLLYKSENHNSGKYSVSSDNPINDIIISVDKNNVSINSRAEGNRVMSSQTQTVNTDIHRRNGKDIRSAEDRRAEMHHKMENRRRDAEKRRKHRSAEREARQKQIRESTSSDRPNELNIDYRTITKNSTDTELIKLKKMYADEGISFSYNNLERDSNGEIVRIYLTINNRHGTVSSTSFGNGKTPIKDIQLGVDSKNVVVKNKK